MFRLRAHGASDVGNVRDNNEDVWLASIEKQLFVVADGLGGHQAGEIASKEAVDSVVHVYEQYGKPANVALAKETLSKCFFEANNHIFHMASGHELLKGMGTTLSALQFCDQNVIVTHVGDSRIYRSRNGVLSQLTQDHSAVKQDGATKGALIKALGTLAFVEPFVSVNETKVHDVYLLCSDGLTDMVCDTIIEKVLQEKLTVGEKVRTLIHLAKDLGGNDNVTVVIVEVADWQEST